MKLKNNEQHFTGVMEDQLCKEAKDSKQTETNQGEE